jgi:pyruvate dehydrogenase E2 component (dihydrolipoamide acetyltransferase)
MLEGGIKMDKVIPVKGMRKIIADTMVESLHTSPAATHFVQADMTNEMAFRKKLQEKYGRRFSANVIFAMATAKTLSEFPYVNASYVNDTIVLHEDINVGFAVAANDGVLVVNIKNCDKKGFVEVADELDRLFTAAKTNKLKYEDITGSTFTIASMAIVDDIVFHVPIINPPELSILGVYRPKDTPVVESGEIVIKPMMYISVVTDHRVIDGLMTGKFISRIKYYIEHPEELES